MSLRGNEQQERNDDEDRRNDARLARALFQDGDLTRALLQGLDIKEGMTVSSVQAQRFKQGGGTRTWRVSTIAAAENDERTQGNSSKIPSYMHYSKLQRKLPTTISSSDDIFSKQENNNHAKRIVQKLYKEEFALVWAQDESTLVLRVDMDDDMNALLEDEPTKKFLFEFCHFTRKYDSTTAESAYISCPSYNSLFVELFIEQERFALVRRVVHRFYRKHAADLLPGHRKTVFEMLQGHYRQNKRYSGVADITVAFVDASFMTDCEKAIYELVRAGEAIETTGRFNDAALVYEDISHLIEKGMWSNCNGHVPDTFTPLSYAGQAYMRAGKLEAAERCLVAALWSNVHQRGETASKWDVNQDGTSVKLFKLAELMSVCTTKLGEVTDLAHCWSPFIGLLHAAEFDFRDCDGEPFYDDDPLLARERLKPQLVASKKKAIKALLALVPDKRNPPEVTKFRSQLLSYVKPSLRGTPSFVTNVHEPFNKTEHKKQCKKSARACMGDYGNRNWRFRVCDNPGCKETGNLRTCPCHHAEYCSKDCQHAHWTIHKQTCAVRKKNQK